VRRLRGVELDRTGGGAAWVMNTRRVGVAHGLGDGAAGYIGAGVNPLGPGPTGGTATRVGSGTTGPVTGPVTGVVGATVR
jgi:hypothetical protein